MVNMRALLLTCLFTFCFAFQSLAADYRELWADFDAREFSFVEKRFLQTSLAFNGNYLGLLDGAWGRISQEALAAYAARNYESAPKNWHTAMLAFEFVTKFQEEGWQIKHFNALGMSFLFPENAYTTSPATDAFVNWNHSKSSLGISVTIADQATTERLHNWTREQHAAVAPIYTVRKTNFAVTSSERRDGSQVYTRSNFLNGAWSTVILSSNLTDKSILQAVASSIAVGKSGPLVLPNQGKLARIIDLAIALSDDDNASSESQSGNKEPASKSMPSSEESDSSGTGFYVSSSGIILTNAHVVEGCTLIDVGGHEAKILEVSNDFDLALLSSQIDENTPYATFSPSPAELNSDVTVVGYPLTGILGGLNVTRGAVSSLKGIGGDIANMQISAPVQPGNSGGPIVNEKGQVVGVVVSKLDAEKIADLIGDIPQNVNFGVRGEIAKLFLFQNGIEPEISTQLNRIESVELARLVATFTVFISCKH